MCATVAVKGESRPGDADTDDDDVPDCAVCLQACLHPVQLPCGHIFCFLCVKGTASRSQRCALCRRDIPPGYVFNPHLLRETELTSALEDGYEWFYEGVNGWWQYDTRTSAELEQSYKTEQPSLEVLIAGFLYVIDFKSMVQMRRSNPSRRRRIKRDVVTIADKKGIAGIKVAAPVHRDRETGDGTDMPVSNAAGPSAVAPAVRQRRTRAARGSDRSLVSVSNAIPADNQQTGAAFSATNARHDAPSLHGAVLNTIPSDGENIIPAATGATAAAAPLAVPRQLRSNTTHDVDDPSLSATVKPTPGSATSSSGVLPCTAGSLLRSGAERCIDDRPLPAGPHTSPIDGQRIRHDITDVSQYHQDATDLDDLATDVAHLEIGDDDDGEDSSVVREVVGREN